MRFGRVLPGLCIVLNALLLVNRASSESLSEIQLSNGYVFALAESGDVYGWPRASAVLQYRGLLRWAPDTPLAPEEVGVLERPVGVSSNGAGTLILNYPNDNVVFDRGESTSLGKGTAIGISESGTYAFKPQGSGLWTLYRWSQLGPEHLRELPDGHEVQIVTAGGAVYGTVGAPVHGFHRFVYRNGLLSYFDPAPSFWMTAASSSGAIVGSASARWTEQGTPFVPPYSEYVSQPWLFRNGGAVRLGPDFSKSRVKISSIPLAINNAGQVVGSFRVASIYHTQSDYPVSGLAYWHITRPDEMVIIPHGLSTSYETTVAGLTESGLLLIDKGHAYSEPGPAALIPLGSGDIAPDTLRNMKILTGELPPPPVLSASEGANPDGVDLNWGEPRRDVGTYQIWRSSTPKGARRYLASTKETSYHDATAEPAVEYYYTVEASVPFGFPYGRSEHSNAALGWRAKSADPRPDDQEKPDKPHKPHKPDKPHKKPNRPKREPKPDRESPAIPDTGDTAPGPVEGDDGTQGDGGNLLGDPLIPGEQPEVLALGPVKVVTRRGRRTAKLLCPEVADVVYHVSIEGRRSERTEVSDHWRVRVRRLPRGRYFAHCRALREGRLVGISDEVQFRVRPKARTRQR